jgi:hypothetical protein
VTSLNIALAALVLQLFLNVHLVAFDLSTRSLACLVDAH